MADQGTLTGLRPYRPGDAAAWDDLVARSCNGTFLHTRRYLAYHGERFRDASWVLDGKAGELAAAFPAAYDPQDASHVVSHPGITFGGIVHDGTVRGPRMLLALQQIATRLRDQGAARLTYAAVPSFYHRLPSSDDLYALFRLSACRRACGITSTIPLDDRNGMPVHRRQIRRAESREVTAAEGAKYLPEFWAVLEQRLMERHEVRPVHTLAEILHLQRVFGDRIRCVVGLIGADVVAGAVIFVHPKVTHVQYMAASELGRETSAMDVVLSAAAALGAAAGCRYFDLGISTERQGHVLNDGLFRFKSSFGGGTYVHESYEIDLAALGRS